MAQIRLTVGMVKSSQSYRIQLDGGVTVREIAQYLSQYDTQVETSTLEVARPLQTSDRLRDIDVQAGDRILMLLQPSRPMQLPAPLLPGDKLLKFRLGDFEINTRGKREVLVGKPDESRSLIPDVDLRYFIAPEYQEYISRNCLWLDYDEQTRTWFMTKRGRTRVMVDEIELGPGRVPLNDTQLMRFHRGSDDPNSADSQALGELRLTVEEVHAGGDVMRFAAGHTALNVYVGSERENQLLNASDNLTMGQVVKGLAKYNKVTLKPNARPFLARLVSPETRVGGLLTTDEEFLYTAGSLQYAQNTLLLRDVHSRDRVFALAAGPEDSDRVLGCRAQGNVADLTLDLDLFDALIIRGHDLRTLQHVSGPQGCVSYIASENTWWIRADERSRVPLFINNLRLTSSAPVQVFSGDVLSVGPSVTHYYARLELEILATAR